MRQPCWCPFQGSKHARFWQCTISAPVDLVFLQITLNVISEYFHGIKHFNLHKLIDYCDQRNSHNYDNSQLLKKINKTLSSVETFREYLYNRVLNHVTTRASQHQYFRLFVTSRANQELQARFPRSGESHGIWKYISGPCEYVTIFLQVAVWVAVFVSDIVTLNNGNKLNGT